MANALKTGLAFLFAKLHGDTTLMSLVTGVYQDGAPEDAAPDYVILGVQSPGVDVLTSTAVRLMSRPLMRVQVTGPLSDFDNLSAAYDRIETLIALVRNDPGGVIACYREEPLYLPEPELIAGKRWLSLGGLYRIEV